jgi:hypothetical protein
MSQIFLKIKENDRLSYKNSKISAKFNLLQDLSVMLTRTIKNE